jgi:hypothetical protein
MLYVEPPVHGIYTYWCMPDFAELIAECPCRPPSPPPFSRRVKEEVRERARPKDRWRFPFRLPEPETYATPLITAASAYLLYRSYQMAASFGPRLAFSGMSSMFQAGADVAEMAPAATETAPALAEVAPLGEEAPVLAEGAPTLVEGAPALAEAVAPVAIPAAAVAISVGGAYALTKYTYNSVVPGAVAAGLGQLYEAMDAAAAKISKWHGPTLDALGRAQDAAALLGDLAEANSGLRGALRPLHVGVSAAYGALVRAAGQMQAIADRIQPQDWPTHDFATIQVLMPHGDYPSLQSPDLATLALFMLSAADALTGLIRKLHAQREEIIEAQSHYEMKRR